MDIIGRLRKPMPHSLDVMVAERVEAADEIERLREACYDLIKQGRNVLHMDGYVGLLKVETHNKFYILMNEIESALQQKDSD